MLNHLRPPRLKDLGSRHSKMANKPFEWAGHHKLSAAQPYVNGLPLKGSVDEVHAKKAACLWLVI